MSNHPPERYEPGELDRTRSNLGHLSEEEAREMARVLNGEIGVERTTPAIQEQYHRLQQLNRRTGETVIYHTSRRSEAEPLSRHKTARAVKEITDRQPGFFDRVRTNFWAASSSCTIIPRLHAMGSLVSFIVPIHERLHPGFILKGDRIFYGHLERFVLAVRSLMSINRRDEVPSLMDAYSLKVLSLLRQWDIETVHRELSVLQRSPRNQPVESAVRLCRALYRPMFQLSALDPAEHIIPVIKRLFDLDLMAYPPDSREADRIKQIGMTLKNELFHLFYDVKRSCAPLLVKLAAIPYAPYPEVFEYYKIRILKFLELGNDDMIPLEPDDLKGDILLDENEPGEDYDTEQEETDGEEPEETTESLLPEGIPEAYEFLGRMFPQSGLERPENFPDLFAYFKPIVSFQKNTDLFHPENPVHQVAVLLAILQDMLYGFRQIIFSEIMDTDENAREIQNEVDQNLARWHRLLDELVCGRILTELVDYCRQIERSPDYRSSDTGLKQENSIRVRVQQSILPHLDVPAIRLGNRGNDRGLPELYHAVAEFHHLLKDTLHIDPETGKSGMRNPSSPFHFEIENFVTFRFRRFLRKKGLPQDNRHLVHYTSLLLGLMDYLLNSPVSHLYRTSRFPLYRFEKGHREIPIYSVQELQTERIIESSDIELTPPEEFLEGGGQKGRDKVSGLYKSKLYQEKIKTAVEEFHDSGRQVSIAVISIPELRILEPGTRDDNLRVIGHTVRGEIREYSDLPFRLDDDTIPVVLPETDRSSAVLFCKRLIQAIQKKLPQTGIHIGVVTYHPTWSAGKFIKTAARTAAEAERHKAPSVLVYQEADTSFEEISLNRGDAERS